MHTSDMEAAETNKTTNVMDVRGRESNGRDKDTRDHIHSGPSSNGLINYLMPSRLVLKHPCVERSACWC